MAVGGCGQRRWPTVRAKFRCVREEGVKRIPDREESTQPSKTIGEELGWPMGTGCGSGAGLGVSEEGDPCSAHADSPRPQLGGL